MSLTTAYHTYLRPLHRFLAGHSFYALALASTLAYGLLAARIGRLHSWGYAWFAWNLALAWVPYAASLWADRLHLRNAAQPWRLLPAAALWLAFLPNAPYLVTDFMHIRARPEMPWLFWYDMMMMAVFAWTGCILGAASLGIMQRIVGDYLGRAASWLFILLTAGLCGVGIYLGRFERWNSWDLIVNPRALARDLIGPLLDPTAYLRPFAMSGLFAAFFLISYLTLAAKPSRQTIEERP
ncbi:MAG TPA: DUF1361 domain-containing protein [Thermomicrobiales bacterium]|jgi:uncharacterized membrane protein